jgi:hypothetical protein
MFFLDFEISSLIDQVKKVAKAQGGAKVFFSCFYDFCTLQG